ncbi:CDP-alcohol phosphatidyltransferase family protein [Dactylosporangium sp. CA-233914]|uniref:CDP-alcohol phosphatidyltransferase family protein n=1 Tax=Dactylosporangium sp. CA-233914 TaxID=3239934 RepID=UPI003D8F9334
MRAPEPLDWDGYCSRWSSAHGGYDPRSAPSPVRGWLRLGHRLGVLAAQAGVRSPDALTLLGLLLAAAAPAVVLAPAGPFLAAVLVLLSAVADTLDGALAVILSRATRLGQVYDAAADRLSEAAWLLAFALLGAPPWLAAACGAVMWLHEYVRARATAAGMSDIGTVTIAERPTRVLLSIFGLLAVLADPRAATVTLAIMLPVSLIGLAQLLKVVRRTLR